MVLWHIIFWAVLTVALVGVEFATVQFVSVWFAAGSIVAFISSLFGIEFYWQVILFVAVSLILLIATRPLVKRFLKRPIIKTNADSLISKECVVIEEISNTKGTGRVHVEGLDWAAKSLNMEKVYPVNATCLIKEIQGVTLVVDSVG